MATQSAYSQGRYQAEMQMMNASTQFGAALGNAIGAALMVKVGESTREGLEYAGEKINTLVRYHMTSVHHDLNLHPYFDRGWRLALIHLEDGTHASIPMVPDLIALRYSITNSVIYNYFENENKKYLIVKALIPTTQIPDSYKLRIFNNTNGKMDEWMLPKPYIVCYDITGLETDEKPLNAEEVSMASPGIDQKLVEEAFFSNKEAVVKEIREGADVNSKDIYGHTALMHACQRGDIKTIKFLLSRNANPRTPDPEGFNAMDYIFMPASKRMPITIQQLARVIKKLKKAGKKFS